MNVTPSNPQRSAPGQSSEATPPARTERAPASPAGAVGTPAGSIDLSPEARTFLKLRARLDGLPQAGHPDRIARLRAAIEGGDYAVSGEDIATAMLRDPAAAGVLGLPRQA